MATRLVVVGDSLLDRDLEGTVERLSPDAPVPVVDDPKAIARPGGAGLAALLAAGDGCEVRLVTALGDDEAGVELGSLLQRNGVDVVNLGTTAATPEKIRIRAGGRTLVRVDRGGRWSGSIGPLTAALEAQLAGADAVLVSDYGRGVAAEPSVRAALARLPARVPVIWDPHPRGPQPTRGVRLATPNAKEAAAQTPQIEGHSLTALSECARTLISSWGAAAVAITLGPRGALMVDGSGTPLVTPAPPVAGGDPCGAGDRFASTAARLLAEGALATEAVSGAVAAASAFVSSGGASSVSLASSSPKDPEHAPALDARDLVERVRATGGVVVATGGCFDLLHAGHVAMLKAARSLGDCLVVCLNSDESVRRLKGADRPLVSQADRAAVLLAVEGVDGVVLFDEDTPERVLEELRPDVFAKGADYAVSDLPEARVLARWGGQAVVLPYLEGRSSTRLMEEVMRRGHS